jgi:[ribosomal protein S18]-alanine N-acetyltransferase
MNLDGLPYLLAPMVVEDVPTVSAVERIVFTLPWSSSAFTYELRNNPSSEYLVLRYVPWAGKYRGGGILSRSVRRLFRPEENDLSLLGYGGFWMMIEEAHICTLAMRPEWRGRGLGELLLASLIERALARHAEVVTLEARVTNIRAQNLYVKYGFKIVGHRKGYYSDNGEDAVIMTTEPVISAEYQERFRQLTQSLHERLLGQPDVPPVMEQPQVSS